MPSSDHFSRLEQFIVRNGFVWGPEPELYNGLAGFYTYGPLGKLLKNGVEREIRKKFTSLGFFEVEAPIILPEIVWEASGHLSSFTDSLVRCPKCNGSYRVDKLLEEHGVVPDELHLSDQMKKNQVPCPSCKKTLPDTIEEYLLMMETSVAGRRAFNRPETATATYLPFPRYNDFFRKKVPFGVFQIGKAFRNEISPRQHILRSREFTQAEAQLFLDSTSASVFGGGSIPKHTATFIPAKTQKAMKLTFLQLVSKKHVRSRTYARCLAEVYDLFRTLGIPGNRMRFRQHREDERAHYAIDAWDLEIESKSFGWIECCGVHDRGSYDLTQHEKFSKKRLRTENGEVPTILEIAFGVDRPVFLLMDLYYNEEKLPDGERRIVFSIPELLAPIQVAVFPLIKKQGLPEVSHKLYTELQRAGFSVIHDESGSIGRRYRRVDERGVPWAITVDHRTLEDGTVTLRERDSMKQSRVKLAEVASILRDRTL